MFSLSMYMQAHKVYLSLLAIEWTISISKSVACKPVDAKKLTTCAH